LGEIIPILAWAKRREDANVATASADVEHVNSHRRWKTRSASSSSMVAVPTAYSMLTKSPIVELLNCMSVNPYVDVPRVASNGRTRIVM
jgi:hypothetical protein